MVEKELIYESEKTPIQCQENEISKEIIKNYTIKFMENADKLLFLYNGLKIEGENSFKK